MVEWLHENKNTYYNKGNGGISQVRLVRKCDRVYKQIFILIFYLVGNPNESYLDQEDC